MGGKHYVENVCVYVATFRLCSVTITEFAHLRTAFQFEKEHRPQGIPEVTALVHDATLHPPPPRGRALLGPTGPRQVSLPPQGVLARPAAGWGRDQVQGQVPGILIGHVSSEEAFAPILARAANRAAFMRLLPLMFSEHIALFQEWVLPLFIFPARAYFPTDQVVAQLAVVYRTALQISSWGLTLPILEPPPSLGGNNLPQPRPFLLWQHATPFLLSAQEPLSVPPVSRNHFEHWASTFGVPLDPIQLPWLQLGPIPWKTMPFLGTACKAYLLLRKAAPMGVPTKELAPRLTPWHSTLFRTTNSNTYYSPGLIRAGIQTIQQLMAMGGNLDFLPRTWAPVYKDVAPKILQPPHRRAKQ